MITIFALGILALWLNVRAWHYVPRNMSAACVLSAFGLLSGLATLSLALRLH
jgi:hypothetical protein